MSTTRRTRCSLLKLSALCGLILGVAGSAAPAQGKAGPIPISQGDIPLVIAQSGSYELVGNLSVTDPAVTAIAVDAHNVTIDLNGFHITGPGKGNGTGMGVRSDTPTTHDNVVVRNGKISSWGSVCVHLPGHANRAEQLIVSHCGNDGIFVGRASVVTASQVSFSGSGVNTDDGSIVSENTLYSNDGMGIFTSGDAPGPLGGVAVLRNNCRLNGIGIKVKGSGSRVEGNVVSQNSVGMDLSLGTNNYFASNLLQGNAVTFVGEGDDTDGASIDGALANVVLP
ncbi:MAG TPA: right-handed parallel beta-helix repeat-containing protein [Thermoanaerobaculia bacterium]